MAAKVVLFWNSAIKLFFEQDPKVSTVPEVNQVIDFDILVDLCQCLIQQIRMAHARLDDLLANFFDQTVFLHAHDLFTLVLDDHIDQDQDDLDAV